MSCDSSSHMRERDYGGNWSQGFAKKICIEIVSCPTSENPALFRLGRQQVFEVLRAFIVFNTYAMKRGRIRKLFFHTLSRRNVRITLLNGTRVLQLVLDKNLGKAHIPYKLSVQTAFDAQLYFQTTALMSKEVRREKLNFIRNAENCTLAGMAARFCRTFETHPTRSRLSGPLRIVILPDLWLMSTVIQFPVFLQWLEGTVSLIQWKPNLGGSAFVRAWWSVRHRKIAVTWIRWRNPISVVYHVEEPKWHYFWQMFV